jgi:hypothetical protein
VPDLVTGQAYFSTDSPGFPQKNEPRFGEHAAQTEVDGGRATCPEALFTSESGQRGRGQKGAGLRPGRHPVRPQKRAQKIYNDKGQRAELISLYRPGYAPQAGVMHNPKIQLTKPPERAKKTAEVLS